MVAFKNKLSDKTVGSVRFIRHNFKPSVWPSVFSAIGIVCSIAIGFWQISEYRSVNILIEKINRNSVKSVEELPPASMLGDPVQYDYRPVTASGEMIFLKSMNLVHMKSIDGQEGYRIITPLRMENGETVLIDRGWVKEGHVPNNAYWQNTGITVKGFARVPELRGHFTDDNNVKKNEWHWLDLDAMAKYAGVLKLHPLIIEQEKTADPNNTFPVGGQTVLKIRNYHYGVFIFCIILSVILLVTWIMDSLRHGMSMNKEEANSPAKAENDKEDEDTKSPGSGESPPPPKGPAKK